MESTEDQFSTLEEGDPFVLDLGIKDANERKRRFSEQQIKSLETMFETQTKLEPRKKLQLARELGLQPRQVAIWFQNKRARWKSKQLEREYNSMRSDYDKLLSSYEVLKKEKQVLVKQLLSMFVHSCRSWQSYWASNGRTAAMKVSLIMEIERGKRL